MEQIKQEIINSIYENGENLITGPILQEVLLDMVDDVNSKVASASVAPEIVNKTGSWDDAADWIEENSSSLVHETDLDGYATEQWVEDQGYLKEIPEGYATTESLNDLSESVAEAIESIPSVDLSGYATTQSVNEATESVKDWVEAKHYLTTASLSGSVTEESVQFMINDATSSVKDWVGDQNYATETFVSQAIAEIPGTDLTGYATEQWVEEQGYLKEHQDISGLATTESVNSLSESVAQDFENLDIPDVSGYLPTASFNLVSASFDERINAITGSDLSGYATTASLNELSASLSESIPDVSGFATTESLNQVSSSLSASIAAITGSSVDLSGYVTTSSFEDLEGRVDVLEEGVTNLASARDALEGAGIIEWNDEEEAYTAVPLATSESVSALSESVRSLGNQVNGLGEDLDTLNGTVAGLASTSSLNSLSESVATDLGSLDERVTEVENGKVDWDTYDTERAEFSQSVASDITSLSESIAAISGSDLSGYVTTASYNQDSASFDERINAITGSDLSGYATTASLNELSESLNDYLPISGGDVTGDLRVEGRLRVGPSSTSVTNSIAVGKGVQTLMEGGVNLGQFNYSASNQLFSVGVGVTQNSKRNAISVHKDNNQGSSSVYIQGVGDYNGRNPNPGTNDIASVLNTLSSSFDTRISEIVVTGSGVDTGLRSFLFGTSSQTLSSIGSSVSNVISSVSNNVTLGFVSVPDEGRSIGIIVHNTSSGSVKVSLPATVVAGGTTYNLINNGIDNSGSFNIEAGEYGDIVVTRQGTNLYLRTSIDISDIEVDLSGYVTTASFDTVSASFDQRVDTLESASHENDFWESGEGAGSVRRKDSLALVTGENGLSLGQGSGKVLDWNYYRCDYEVWTPQPSDQNPRYYLSHEVNTSYWDHVNIGDYLVSANDHYGRTIAQVVNKSSDISGSYIDLNKYVGTPNWLMLVQPGDIVEGSGSIAVGLGAYTKNDAEVALGKYNATASSQIFSVGVGPGTGSRINAISVVTGSSPSASVYVYGVGSYNGTNPQPGVNDLATVVSRISGSTFTTETWTFILEDSSSVTKNIVVA